MQMKSLLALSVLVSAVFLTGISNAQSDPATVEQAAETQPAVEEATTEAQAEPSAKAKKASKKRHKHKHKHKHRRHHHHVHRHSTPLEQRLAPHYIWSDYRAPCHNFLIGGTLGYAVREFVFDSTFLTPITIPTLDPALTYSTKNIDNGVVMGLFAGWQWRINRFMLGLEANVDFENYEKVEEFAQTFGSTPAQVLRGFVHYDRGDVFGLSTRFGYFVTPFFLPYVRVGAQFSRDEVNYQSFIGPVPVLGVFLPDFISDKKDVWGYVLGIGAEFPTYIGASTIRIEYNFAQTQSIEFGDGTLPVVGTNEFHHPETHVGRISWVWNFL